MKTRKPLPTTFLINIFVALLLFSCTHRLAAQCTAASAATSYTSNNGSRGAMFNITAAASDVIITSFDANIYGGTTAKYEIYYKAGSYVGSETNAAAWTMAGSVNSLTSLGNNVATPLPIPLSITIPAGATYGFYITNTASGGVNYTSSAVTGVTLASNSDLTLTGGVGKSYPFGSTYSYRLINCTVHYYTGNAESGALATINTTSPAVSQSTSGSTLYSNGCNALIAKVTGSGPSPASGSTVARVWIDATQSGYYVKRHYQVSPAVNGSGRVTLYFTDAEFNAFNTQSPAPALLLPVSTDPGSIALRKANLLIEKRSGTSSDNSGNHNTYTGSVETIDPNDADIIWNGTSGRWEVSFDVSGFSGFFAKTSLFTLPLKLLNFSGSRSNNTVKLAWQTAAEINTRSFEVERSADGIVFTTVTTVAAKGSGNHTYSFTDPVGYSNRLYYRLKMIDRDEAFTYSNSISISGSADINGASVSVYPNPAKGAGSITIHNNLPVGSKARLTGINGRLLKTIIINSTIETVDISRLPAGIYVLRFDNGAVQKIVKE